MSYGAKNLYFDNDYRAFFGKTNPQLDAFERLQKTYTKIDNVQFAVEPELGSNASSVQILAAIEELTELAWQIPYSLRVDSISNYQHTEVDEDDLLVEDLYGYAEELTEQELKDMSDKEFNDYCSKIRKKLIEVTKEVGEFEVY